MPVFAAIGGIASAVGGAAGAAGTIGSIASAAGGIAGALGGVGGSQTGTTRQLAGESQSEAYGRATSMGALGQMGDLTNAGAGTQDVTAATGAQRDLAGTLQQYSQQGGNMPTQQDIQQQNTLAQSLYAGRRQAITGNFAEQQQNFAQQAATQGRNPLDPVFRNKLMQEQTKQLGQLGAEQGSFATQQAMEQPGQRLQFMQGRAQILGGLASQAMSNRQALFNMGNKLQEQGMGLREKTAGTQVNQGQQGGIGGAMAGIGMGAGIGQAIGGIAQANPFTGASANASAGYQGMTDARFNRSV